MIRTLVEKQVLVSQLCRRGPLLLHPHNNIGGLISKCMDFTSCDSHITFQLCYIFNTLPSLLHSWKNNLECVPLQWVQDAPLSPERKLLEPMLSVLIPSHACTTPSTISSCYFTKGTLVRGAQSINLWL